MKQKENATAADMAEERDQERAAEGLARVMKVGLLAGGVLLALGALLLLAACHKESADAPAGGTAMVTVSTSQLDVSMEGFGSTEGDEGGPKGTANGHGTATAKGGRAVKEAVAEYGGIKAMTLAFFDAQGNAVFSTTQLRADNTTYTTFGQFGAELPLGTYTMVALGYGSEQPMTLNGATAAVFTADRCRETFVVSQAVNVTSTNPLTLNAELSRVVSKVLVRSTDTRTAGVDSVRVTFAAGGKGVNPQTGLSTTNNGLSNCVAISTAVGAASSTISYLFLGSDQQTMNITVETIKTNGSVYSTRTVTNVPLQRNKITVLRGPMYSTASGAGFTVSTAYLGDTTFVDF
ncbi:MAG: FimB/Mfa2 family fimbrial subunit [Bacteroidales bacterium]|nr:FimB/Mfa2 family fimbrial subunit [Bacteroidales bacterium]